MEAAALQTREWERIIGRLFPAQVSLAVAAQEEYLSCPWPGEHAGDVAWPYRRRRQYAAGRSAARMALTGLGLAAQAIPRMRDGAPSWPPGVTGSITHCDLLCCSVAAFRKDIAGIGIDAEAFRTISDRLGRSILTGPECDRRGCLSPRLASVWPLLAFSAKEAFFKCYYPLSGARLELEDIAVEPIEHATAFAGAAHSSGAFKIRLLRTDLPLAAEVPRFFGRYLVTNDLVVTGMTARFS